MKGLVMSAVNTGLYRAALAPSQAQAWPGTPIYQGLDRYSHRPTEAFLTLTVCALPQISHHPPARRDHRSANQKRRAFALLALVLNVFVSSIDTLGEIH